MPAPEPEIEVIRLFDDPFLLAVPADDARPEIARIRTDEVDLSRLILLEQGHCLRDQALAFCAPEKLDMQPTLGTASLATIMQLAPTATPSRSYLKSQSTPKCGTNRSSSCVSRRRNQAGRSASPFDAPRPAKQTSLRWASLWSRSSAGPTGRRRRERRRIRTRSEASEAPATRSQQKSVGAEPTLHARVNTQARSRKKKAARSRSTWRRPVAGARRRANSPDGETSALRVRLGRDLPPSAEDRFVALLARSSGRP